MTASTAFAAAAGLAMAATAVPDAPPVAVALAVLAAALVLISLRVQRAAVPAVLATVIALFLGYPSAALAAAAGLAGCIYLLNAYGISFPAAAFAMTKQTMIGACGFAVVGAFAASIPADVAWLPVLAPIAAVLLSAVAVWPYSGHRHDDVG